MSKLFVLFVAFSVISGCDDSSSPLDSPHWAIDAVIDGARFPVMSPDGEYVLFSREGPNGGLYLWHQGTETRLTANGTAVRPDYAWSPSDPDQFAFTIPGSSEGAGVYIATTTNLIPVLLSPYGQQPEFSPADRHLLFSGSAADSQTSGIWRADLNSGILTRLTASGERPRLNPTGELIAYGIPQPGSNGAMLVSRPVGADNHVELARRVASFDWISDYELLVEVVSDTLALPISPVIGRCNAQTGTIVLTEQSATRVVVFANRDYAFSRLRGDLLAELVVVSSEGMFTFPDSLTFPSGQSASRFVAAGPTTCVVVQAL